MLWTFRFVMLLLGLGVVALALAGIVSLVRRQWPRGFWLGVGTTGGGIVGFAITAIWPMVFWQRLVEEIPYERKAAVLADAISNSMNLAAVALLSMPIGILIAVAGAIAWWRGREKTANGRTSAG
ncbi:MAG: hypothetical protein JW751_12405 [Polyangiaceae bacterium]|nr:hypothetical protein [Polyangiaceae bacterium]